LWYLLFLLAKRYGAKTVLINGRVSDRSYPRYKNCLVYKQIFKNIDEGYAQRTKLLGSRKLEISRNEGALGGLKNFLSQV